MRDARGEVRHVKAVFVAFSVEAIAQLS